MRHTHIIILAVKPSLPVHCVAGSLGNGKAGALSASDSSRQPNLGELVFPPGQRRVPFGQRAVWQPARVAALLLICLGFVWSSVVRAATGDAPARTTSITPGVLRMGSIENRSTRQNTYPGKSGKSTCRWRLAQFRFSRISGRNSLQSRSRKAIETAFSCRGRTRNANHCSFLFSFSLI